MAKPNPNLWSVDVTSTFGTDHLFVLARNAGSAERKATAFIKRSGARKISVHRIKHQGTIDVF